MLFYSLYASFFFSNVLLSFQPFHHHGQDQTAVKRFEYPDIIGLELALINQNVSEMVILVYAAATILRNKLNRKVGIFMLIEVDYSLAMAMNLGK